MSIRAIAHSTVLLLALSLNVAWAQSFEEGIAAYNRGDYQTAYEVFRALAEGDDAGAQSMLGLMYDNGEGVPQDSSRAAQWYRAAAEQGEEYAQLNLGFMYGNGEGIPQDFSKASRWFRAAAEQGNAKAQFNLGLMYAKGDGVLQNNITAHMWFNIASANGHQKAREVRSGMADLMSRDAIAEAQSRARTCMESNYQDCN